MPSLSGAVQLIGVRAVILDVRNYIADGKRIEAANKQIFDSTKKLETASNKVSIAQAKLTAANTNLARVRGGGAPQAQIAKSIDQENTARNASIRAITAQEAAEQKLATAVAKSVVANKALAEANVAVNAKFRNARGQFATAPPKVVASQVAAEKQATAAIIAKQSATQRFESAALNASFAQQKLNNASAKVATLRSAPTEAQVAQAIKAQAAAEKEVTAAITARDAAQTRLAASQGRLGVARGGRLQTATQLGAIVGAAAVVAGTVAATRAASSYQTALAKINTLTDTSTQDTNLLGKKLLELARTVPRSPDELGAAAYFVLSSGIHDVGLALQVTTLAAKDAAIGLGTTDEVARILTATINAYGKTNISASQASDILVAAVKEGSAEASDFASSLGRVLPVAANLNVGFDELTASIAAMTNTGLSAEEATTALRGILNELENPAQGAKDALASVGLTIESLRSSIQDKGFVETMRDLAARFNNNSSALTAIIPNVRALTGFLSAFVSQGEKTSTILTTIRHSAGITDSAFEKMSHTFDFQVNLLTNQLRVAMILIGTTVLPILSKAVADLTVWFQKNQKSIQEFISQGLKVLVTVLVSAAKGLGIIAQLLGVITGSKVGAATALAGIGGALIWALPGGPYIKGLLIIAAVLGQISAATGPKGGIAKELAARNQKEVEIFGLKSGGALNKLFLGSSKGLTEEQFQAAKAADQEKESTDLLGDAMRKADEAFKGAGIDLPKLTNSVGESGEAAAAAAEKLKQLTQDFQKSSEAAGQVKSLTEELGLFGQVSQDLAKALNLSATAAGNIQGVDAVVRSEQRAAAEAFNFTAALATVASAFQRSANVAQQIVLGLARSALSASQAAAAAIFSRPTREVVNLNVNLAQARLGSAQSRLSNNPQINLLRKQLEHLNIQTRLSKSNSSSQSAANSSAKAAANSQLDELKRINQQAADAAATALDQMKLADDEARAAFEKMNSSLERLIDANRQAAADLQEKFLAANEELQHQINVAIGRGDTAGALALVEQQKTQAKAYQSNAKAIEKNIEKITKEQKQKELDERDRAREAALAQERAQIAENIAQRNRQAQEAALESTNKGTEAQDNNTSSLTDNTSALDDQRQKIQDQIDSLSSVNDSYSQNEQAIQDQIDVYQAQSDVLKALVDAADNTILTQGEQAAKARELIDLIGIESQAVRDLAKATGTDLIPEMQIARDQFKLLQGAIDVLTNDSIRNNFIAQGLDPAAERLKILAMAAGELTTFLTKITTSQNEATISPETQRGIDKMMQLLTQQENDISAAIGNATRAYGTALAEGTREVETASQTGSMQISNTLRASAISIGSAGSSVAMSLQGTASILDRIKAAISLGGAKKNAQGGVYSSPTLALVGETHQREAIVPLDRPARAREIMGSIPPSVLASILPRRGGGAVFAPNITVSGETLESMETAAVRAVQMAFRDARFTSIRSGGLISQGLGPSR